jgi:hypothetical protein
MSITVEISEALLDAPLPHPPGETLWEEMVRTENLKMREMCSDVKAMDRIGMEYSNYISTHERHTSPFPITPEKVWAFLRSEEARCCRQRLGNKTIELPSTRLGPESLSGVSVFISPLYTS